jgi:hypothetical protein
MVTIIEHFFPKAFAQNKVSQSLDERAHALGLEYCNT